MNNDGNSPSGNGGGEGKGQTGHEGQEGEQDHAAGDYEVGYRRPPKNTRFVKGSSGNRKGRPKGSTNLSILIAKSLGRKLVVRENGRERKAEAGEIIVASLTNKAMKGDLTASRFLFERMEAADLQAETVSGQTTADIDRDDLAVIEAYFKSSYGG